MSATVVAKCAVSLDGCLDDSLPGRLILSSPADFAELDAARALADAVLVGAETVRRDNPRLVLRDDAYRARRRARGKVTDPMKVTLTRSGNLDPRSDFFQLGDSEKLVYAAGEVARPLADALGDLASVVACEEGAIDPFFLFDDLRARGVERLLVQGGSRTLALFAGAGLLDELEISVAPFVVGAPNAPRIDLGSAGPMTLLSLRQLGDLAILTYRPCLDEADRLRRRDRFWLREAIERSRACAPSPSAFSVGAVLVDESGRRLATGFSRETDPASHAEEVVLAKARQRKLNLARTTLYSSLEPCGRRKSKTTSCAELIQKAGIGRVVFALAEPPLFVAGQGADVLQKGGIEVVQLTELASLVEEVNRHLLRRGG